MCQDYPVSTHVPMCPNAFYYKKVDVVIPSNTTQHKNEHLMLF